MYNSTEDGANTPNTLTHTEQFPTSVPLCTGFPTRYRTRHFFNNSNTNEDIATKQTHTTDTFLFISHTSNVFVDGWLSVHLSITLA